MKKSLKDASLASLGLVYGNLELASAKSDGNSGSLDHLASKTSWANIVSSNVASVAVFFSALWAEDDAR